MEILDLLTCLLRNLYADFKKQQLELDMEKDWFEIGKGIRQGCILSLCLFNFYAEYVMRNGGLDVVVSGDSWGSQEGCQGPFRPSGRNRGLPLRHRREQALILPRGGNHVVCLELRRHSRGTTGISAFPLGWPWEAQSSPRVARESWGLRSSHCRAEETSLRRVSGT